MTPDPLDLVPLRLVPVEVFAAGLCGDFCEHCDTHEGYGLGDAVLAWSDCNRAVGKIYRVDDTDPANRQPGETATVYAPRDALAFFETRWGEDEPPTRSRLEADLRERIARDVEAARVIEVYGDDELSYDGRVGYNRALAHAARVIRGGGS